MKKLILKLFFFSIIAIAGFHLFFGIILPRLYVNSGDTEIQRWINFYEKPVNASGIIIGSSRAHRGYNPRILTEKTGKDFHNIAMHGMPLSNYSLILQDYLLINQAPEIVLINIDIQTLAANDLMGGINLLLPGIKDNSQILNNIYQFRHIKYYRPYGYFFYKEQIIDKIEFPMTTHYNGFGGLNKTWENPPTDAMLDTAKMKPYKINKEESERYIKNIVDVAQKHEIKYIIFSLAPYHKSLWSKTKNKKELVEFMEKMAEKYGITLINFLESDIKNHTKYYYDAVHLNLSGSQVFTAALADSLLIEINDAEK